MLLNVSDFLSSPHTCLPMQVHTNMSHFSPIEALLWKLELEPLFTLFIAIQRRDQTQVLNVPVILGSANTESCTVQRSYKIHLTSLADTGAGRPRSPAGFHDHP